MNEARKIQHDENPLTVMPITRKKNPRRLLYIFYIPLLLIEWSATLACNTAEVVANAFRDLAISLKQFIHAETKPADTKQPATDKGL